MRYTNLALVATPEFHQYVRQSAFKAQLTTSALLKRLVNKEAVQRAVEERLAELRQTSQEQVA